MKIKIFLKNVLLSTGIYYKIHQLRFGVDEAQECFYSRYLSKNDLVFDVGANIGNRSHIFSRLYKKVIAIEPQRQCIKHLRSRFMFNNKVIIKNFVLSELNKIVPILSMSPL